MNTTNKEKSFMKKLFKDVSENVKEGASFVGKKVAETSAKAYVASSELVSETSDKIHDYTEKQALQKSEKKIMDRQNELIFAFGEFTLAHYLTTDSLHKTFLTSSEVNDIVEEYKANEKQIKEIVKAIKKLEK